jgi:hypothetical protein
MWSNAKNGLVQSRKQGRTSPSYLPRNRKLSRAFAGKQKKNGNRTIPVFLVWVTGLEPAASTTPTDKISFFRCFLVFPVLSCPGKQRFPCSRVLLCPNSPCVSMVWICGQNFCCGQYVVVMWSSTPSEFCRNCGSGGVCIVALVAAVVKRFRRWKSGMHSQRKGKAE